MLPDEVKIALSQFKSAIDVAVNEYNELGTVSEDVAEDLKEAWHALLDAVYLPDIIRDGMDGRVITIIVNRLKGRNFPHTGVLADVDVEQIRTAANNILENAEGGNIDLQTLLTGMEGLDEFAGRISMLSRFAKISFFEAFMLTPVFNCQIQ